MTRLADHHVPRLLRGVRTKRDAVRGRCVLLAPERVLKLDGSGAVILAEIDGERTLGEVIEALAAKYDSPTERIGGDVRAFLEALIERRMAEAS